MDEKNLTQEQIDKINNRFDDIAEEVIDCGNSNILCDMIPLDAKIAFIKEWNEGQENAGFDEEE